MQKHELLAQLKQAQKRIAHLDSQLAAQRLVVRTPGGACGNPGPAREKLSLLIEKNASHYGEMERILDILDG